MLAWICDNTLLFVAGGFLVLAAGLYSATLFRGRDSGKTWRDVTLALGSAAFASGVIAVGLFAVEQPMLEQRERETRLLLTADLTGYDPGPPAFRRGRR